MQNKELVEQNEKTKETPISEKNKELINKYIDYLKFYINMKMTNI